MPQISQLIGNEAHKKTLEMLRSKLYTQTEVDAMLAELAGQALTYDPTTRSVSGMITYDANTRSVSGWSLSGLTVHTKE